jgi:alkylation response protein AidB-like acyl-CoA dehydrogenase
LDFGFSEVQEMLRKTARDFFAENCSRNLVRAWIKDEKGYSPDIWKKMAELGWMGLIVPEEYGGSSGNLLDLTVLLEEMGKALVPSPFVSTIVYVGLPIIYSGSEDQKRELLPKIAAGEIVATLALTEPNARYDKAGIEVQARIDDGNWLINGTKLFVPDAHVADWFICVARSPRGITLFLINAKNQGINCTVLDSMVEDRQCEVHFDKVQVPDKYALGGIGKGWRIVERIKEWGALAQCALISGMIQQIMEMTVEYAKTRVQFGQPIGKFQVVQHKCVDIVADVEAVKLLTYQAAWRLSEQLPATMEILMAKARASDAVKRVCLAGHTIHGGVGLTSDHDMQLYFRRSKAAEFAFGNADFQRELLAQAIGI